MDEGDYAVLRGPFNAELLEEFFATRRIPVALRVAQIVSVGLRIWRVWTSEESLPEEERTRADVLRDSLAGLGPVFLKIGQTLSQRPDIIGEVCPSASEMAWAQGHMGIRAEGHKGMRTPGMDGAACCCLWLVIDCHVPDHPICCCAVEW